MPGYALLLVGCLLASGACALAAEAADDQVVTEIKRLEGELARAVVEHDLPTIRRIYAESYVFTDNDARMDTREGFLSAYQAASSTIRSLRFDDVVVTPYDGCAVVRGLVTVERASNGVTTSRVSRYTRFYVQFPQGWRAVAGHTSAVRNQVSGL